MLHMVILCFELLWGNLVYEDISQRHSVMTGREPGMGPNLKDFTRVVGCCRSELEKED